ncbi:MAG: LysR family transcriptional regulator [Lachnospiraceae bacterium]
MKRSYKGGLIMDLTQLQYILQIAEENNITKAAEKLFISQSALNQQLLKLEKELGTQLFHRSRSNWRPTEAGRIYIDGAKAAMQIKKDTYNHIYDVSNAQKGRLTVGLTPGRGLKMFTSIYPTLHQTFPHLEVVPIEMRVRPQQNAISNEQIDLGFLALDESNRTADTYLTLGTEELVVIIPSGHPLAEKAAPMSDSYPVIDIAELRYEPFVLMDKHSTLRAVCDKIFAKAGFTPHVLFETNNTGSITTMVESTLCCGIVPNYYAAKDSDKLSCFSLDYHPSWELAISYRKGGYLSSGAKEFIRLAQDYWAEHL